MRPFKKSLLDTSLEDGIAELMKFRRMGESFNYLGRRMIVTGHCEWMPGMATIYYIPCLKADYADDLGILHSASFRLWELPALRNENP
jgi:hypothetical protein